MAEAVKNRVQEYRSLKKITQEDLAKSVGVARQTIIAIEKGNYTPSVLLAIKIAKELKVELKELFYI